jgi:hypothetical protein
MDTPTTHGLGVGATTGCATNTDASIWKNEFAKGGS